ncbi:hypothetical protein M427DRAFT_84632, partial [Gonapodya prolifera JEL478]
AAGMGTLPACSATVVALAQGIVDNISIQKQELSTAILIQAILHGTAKTPTFQQAQKTLVNFVQQGMLVRMNNQNLAPNGSLAVAGLAVVQGAQMAELSLATSLTGNAATDLPNVMTLQTDFTNGMAKNQEN